MADSPTVAPITLAVATAASPAAAWQALTEPAQIAEWFTDASPLGPVGSTYTLDFGDGSVVAGSVLALEPGRSFAHAWHWAGSADSETTRVVWTVVPMAGGGSQIELLHDRWAEAGLDSATRDEHAGYWAGYLEDLRELLAGV